MTLDFSTASSDISCTHDVMTNVGPPCQLVNTGCRLRKMRSVLLSQPLLMTKNKQQMFQMTLNVELKQVIPENKMIWAVSSSANPKDIDGIQGHGLEMEVGTCRRHQHHLCLFCMCNETVMCIPIIPNKKSACSKLHLAVVLDSDQKMQA